MKLTLDKSGIDAEGGFVGPRERSQTSNRNRTNLAATDDARWNGFFSSAQMRPAACSTSIAAGFFMPNRFVCRRLDGLAAPHSGHWCTRSEGLQSALNVDMCMMQHWSLWALNCRYLHTAQMTGSGCLRKWISNMNPKVDLKKYDEYMRADIKYNREARMPP